MKPDDDTLDRLRDMLRRGFVSDLGDLLEHVLDMIPEAILVVNRNGTIVLVNAAFERLTGYKRNDLVMQQVETLVPHNRRGLHRKQRERYSADPRPRLMAMGATDIALLLSDGTEFPIFAELIPQGEYTLVKARAQ